MIDLDEALRNYDRASHAKTPRNKPTFTKRSLSAYAIGRPGWVPPNIPLRPSMPNVNWVCMHPTAQPAAIALLALMLEIGGPNGDGARRTMFNTMLTERRVHSRHWGILDMCVARGMSLIEVYEFCGVPPQTVQEKLNSALIAVGEFLLPKN